MVTGKDCCLRPYCAARKGGADSVSTLSRLCEKVVGTTLSENTEYSTNVSICHIIF